jgi:hypothetical protein
MEQVINEEEILDLGVDENEFLIESEEVEDGEDN